MEQSILRSIKKLLNISDDDPGYDTDLIFHINTSFMVLHQLGYDKNDTPNRSFVISDETTTWTDFISGRDNIEAVKSYVYLKVRLLFDPPSTSFAIEAFKKQLEELEWRLSLEVRSIA